MDQGQNVPIRQNQTKPEDIEVKTSAEEQSAKKNNIPTRLGSLIILLVATIAGAGVWWCAFSYEEPKLIDWDDVVRQMQERRVVETEVLSDYEVREDGVYYKGELIEGADPETFEDLDCTGSYAKDKQFVYHVRHILVGADSKTFECLDGGYGKDETTVYFFGGKVEDAVSETFEYIDYSYSFISDLVAHYAKDKNSIYINGQVFPNIDPETFQYVGSSYIKDKEHVYGMFGVLIKGVDPANCTAENLGGCKFPSEYEIKADGVYYKGKLIEGADPETFEFFVNEDGRVLYGIDKNYVFSRKNFIGNGDTEEILEILKDADPKTFVSIGFNYGKDAENVFSWMGSMSGLGSFGKLNADSKTFVLLNDGMHAKDAKYVYYYWDKTIKGADPESFVIINEIYSKDKNYVYHQYSSLGPQVEVVKGVDPENCTTENLKGCETPTE